MHDLTIITTLAGALAFALVIGWLTQRLGLSTVTEIRDNQDCNSRAWKRRSSYRDIP